MKKSLLTILVAALLMLLASACKRSQTNEPAAVVEDPAAASADEQVPEKAEAPAEAQAPTDASEAADGQAVDGSGRTIGAIPLPGDWVKASVQTPKGVKVSFGVPGEWVDLPSPNESTLLVKGAPYKIAAGGTKVTAVAVEFVGGRTELAEYTRNRLVTFATVAREGPLRVGKIDGYEFVASWKTPSGDKDTVQLLVATGKEAIAVTCEFLPGQLDTLSGLCDEIFATVSIEGATPKK